MSDNNKILGLWWLPENPSDRWVGTLLAEPNKSPHLDFVVPSGFSNPFKCEAPTAIHGLDRHGKPVTLLHPGLPGITTSQALSQVRFSAGYAVLGIEIADHNAFKIDSLSFGMQHLFEWVGRSGFKNIESSGFHDIHIRYERPSDQLFIIDSDLSLELRASYSSSDNWRNKTLEEDTTFTFISKKGLDLLQSNDLITAVRHLIHFAVLQPVFPLSMTANKNDYGITLGDRFIPQEIKIYNSIISERVESEFGDERWVYKFKDLQTDFGTFLAKWLGYVKEYDEALGCYFSTIYHHPPHAMEHLSLTQALDAYHGNKFSSHALQEFEQKIFGLADTNKAHLAGLVDDPADFAKTVLHNRNFYTHHNPKWKMDGRVLTGSKLFRLNEKLRFLFQLCVLSDMGIPPERFSRLRRQLATTIIDIL